MLRLLSILLFICFSDLYAKPARKVLLLGDEVMTAYQDEVVKLIGDQADCTFLPMPREAKVNWPEFVKGLQAKGPWDLIHFSYGREIMRHVDEDGNPVKDLKLGKPLVPVNKVYGVYIDLIRSLKSTKAFLIGCTMTPINGTMPDIPPSLDHIYGGRFQQMLGPQGVKINDLADYTKTRLGEMVRKNSNLPTKLGKQLMAEQVVNSILEGFNEGQDPNRPRILMVGDSIVGGYYSATRDLFAGKAIVYSGGTTYNDRNPNWKKIVDKYIETGGEHGWDVIQFNWGLHAVKFVDANNKTCLPEEVPDARLQFSADEYLKNLELFLTELKRTKAKLVFATTTPIPEGCKGPIRHLDLRSYNDPAKSLMKKHNIPVNDHYAFCLPILEKLQIKQDVHFTAHGSAELARRNYEIISKLLPENKR